MRRLGWVIPLLCSFLFCACSDDTQTSGLMTETNTGNKVLARIVNEDGAALANERVAIVDTNHFATDAPVAYGTSDADGYVELDSVKSGEYHLLVEDSAETFATMVRFTSPKDSDSLALGDVVLKKSATMYLAVSARGLALGDTAYIPGTDVFAVVDSSAVRAGVLTLYGIPAGTFRILGEHGAGNLTASFTVDWTFAAGEVVLDSALESNAAESLSITLSQTYSAPGTILNLPFPVRLASSVEHPCLLDSLGEMILLDSSAAQGDSVLYWGVMPKFLPSASKTIDFKVIGHCQESNALALPLGRYAQHFDAAANDSGALGKALWLDSASSPYYISGFAPFTGDSAMTLSLWINADPTSQDTTYTRIIAAKADSSGFTIQQRADRNSVNLRVDTRGGDYNKLFGTAPILDGTWHHYSFRIRGDSVLVEADGAILQKASFNRGNGFSPNIVTPMIGGEDMLRGGVDEVMFFDGSQSDEWFLAFYELQKRVR